MHLNVDQSLTDLKTWCTKELIYLGLEHQRPWRRQYRWLSPQHRSYLWLLVFLSGNKKNEKMIQFSVCGERNHCTCLFRSNRKSSVHGSGRVLKASTAHCKGWTDPCYKCTDSYKRAQLTPGLWHQHRQQITACFLLLWEAKRQRQSLGRPVTTAREYAFSSGTSPSLGFWLSDMVPVT